MSLSIGKRLRAGSEEGIRTLDTGLPYTRFPGVRLQPLGHLTRRSPQSRWAYSDGHPLGQAFMDRRNCVTVDVTALETAYVSFLYNSGR